MDEADLNLGTLNLEDGDAPRARAAMDRARAAVWACDPDALARALEELPAGQIDMAEQYEPRGWKEGSWTLLTLALFRCDLLSGSDMYIDASVRQKCVEESNSAHEVVRLLLERGADPDAATDDGEFALMQACYRGHLKCTQLLLEAGATVDKTGPLNDTPLYMACFFEQTKCAQLLLDAGAAVDRPSNDGSTPLFIACGPSYEGGTLACVKLLSSFGAQRQGSMEWFGDWDAETLCASNNRPQSCAWLCRTRHWTPLHHLEQLTSERVRKLLAAGADPHARPASGDTRTPLERATEVLPHGRRHTAASRALLFAVLPWSPRTHHHYETAVQARAVELMWLGHGLPVSLGDVQRPWLATHAWMEHIVPYALGLEFDA